MYPLISLLLACAVVVLVVRRRQPLPFPPGPPSDPIVGHLWKLPATDFPGQLCKWAKEHGDIMSLQFPGRLMVVLSSEEVCHDLLNKTSSKFSSRPVFPIYDIMGWFSTAFAPYNKEWTHQRKLLNQLLVGKNIESYKVVQTRETNTLLSRFAKQPQDWNKTIDRFAAAIIVKIAYGHDIKSDNDLYLTCAQDADHAMNYGVSVGVTILDTLPWLQHFPSWFPGTHYANIARGMRGIVSRFHDYPMENIQKQIKEGTAEPSFVEGNLRKLEEDGITDAESYNALKFAAGALFSGGADTTAATLSVFMLTMVLFPDCLKRAQREIDEVIGSERLPEFTDKDRLPYVEGIVQEVMRWYTIAPNAMQHLSTEDHVYKGMFIPKGSIMIPNAKAISMDERVYKDPSSFRPERYLSKPEGNAEPFCNAVFGYGRRICPGRHLAMNSLFVSIACIIATFDIKKLKGPDGKEIEPVIDFAQGSVHHLKPFDLSITPRSKKAEKLATADEF